MLCGTNREQRTRRRRQPSPRWQPQEVAPSLCSQHCNSCHKCSSHLTTISISPVTEHEQQRPCMHNRKQVAFCPFISPSHFLLRKGFFCVFFLCFWVGGVASATRGIRQIWQEVRKESRKALECRFLLVKTKKPTKLLVLKKLL